MKKCVCALVFCMFLPLIGYAQQNADVPASKADVQEFFDAMHTRDMEMKMVITMKNQQHEMIKQQIEKQKNLPPDFEAKMDKMIDDLWDHMPIDDLLQAMIPVYQRHFTKGDIKSLVAFYSSPTGQKMVREMPAITAEAMQASSGIIEKTMAETTQRVQQQIAQIQKQNSGSVKNE